MTPQRTTHGFIVDLVTRERLYFQFNPEAVYDSNATEWNALEVHGVHHPRLQYVSGKGRIIRFTLKFFGVDEKDNRTVKQKVDWLRSLVYPDLSLSGSIGKRAPHKVMLSLGALLPQFVAKVNKVDVVYSKVFSGMLDPQYAEVEIELQEYVTNNPVGYADVRRGKR